jgi:hypothetical protein
MRPRAGISVAAIGLAVALVGQVPGLPAMAHWLGLAFAAVGLLLAGLAAAGQSLPGDEPRPTDRSE